MDKQEKKISNDELLYQDYYEYRISDYISTVQISNDEQYLAYGGDDQKLTLMDLKLKSQIRNPIVLNDSVRVCKFSQDSKFIYFGDNDGNFYCFNVNKFKKIFKSRILKGFIYNIIPINNQQIMIKSKNAIKIYSMNSNKLLSTLYLGQSQFIFGLDFDEQNQILIIGDFDNQIVFLKRQNGQKLMAQPSFLKYPIQQLTLLKENQLISRSNSQIILYKIDYDNIQLAVIRNYTIGDGAIYHISPALNETKFIATLVDQIIVLDENLIELYPIQIGYAGLLHRDCLTQQINSLNYLIIPYQFKVKVLKRVIDWEKKQ